MTQSNDFDRMLDNLVADAPAGTTTVEIEDASLPEPTPEPAPAPAPAPAPKGKRAVNVSVQPPQPKAADPVPEPAPEEPAPVGARSFFRLSVEEQDALIDQRLETAMVDAEGVFISPQTMAEMREGIRRVLMNQTF